MSLINDALKRAQQAQKNETRSTVSPMRPSQPGRQERNLGMHLLVPIILVLVVAFFLIGLAFGRHNNTPRLAARAAAPNPPAPNPPPVVLLASNPPNRVLSPSISVSPPSQTIPVPAAPTAVPPTLLVQGIAYELINPWAIINGKTVHVGDWVGGMKVMEIARNAVTLAGNGQTKTFGVGPQ